MRLSKNVTSLIVSGAFILVFANEAYAYLDLGSGSYILQLIMATLFGILFTLKMYWRKIKNLFANFFHIKIERDD